MIEKRQIIDLVRQLPTIPQSLLELQQLLVQNDATVEQVERVISSDSALTANVLRLANSAAFGLSRKVADVAHAITLIGFKVLRNLAHTAAFSKAMPAELPGYRVSGVQFLRHSYVTAVLAETFGEACHVSSGKALFTAGLLHDMGKLVLSTFLADRYVELARLLETQGMAFVEAELQVLGLHHGQAAGWVGEHWHLPPELVAAAEWHHDPDQAPAEFACTVDVVHVADVASHAFGFGADLGELARDIQKGPFSRLQLTGDMLEKVASGVLERLVQELPTENQRSVEPNGPRPHKILVVDDSSIIRQMVCKSLSLAGLPPYEITEASDGEEALDILLQKERTFSLVLADIHMPRMTGTQLVAAMAGNESLKSVPVVIISSDSNSANQTKLHALGVRALLKKPFRPEQIRAIVHPILTDEARRL